MTVTGAAAAGIALTFAFCGAASGLDLGVYRAGGLALLEGRDIYGPILGSPENPGLPFTYPPFAALLFTVLAWAPLGQWMGVVAVVTTVLHLAVLRDLEARLRGHGVPTGVAWLVFPSALLASPFVATLEFGQINVLLMAAIHLATARSARAHARWWWLPWMVVGLTAGIKLTPLALMLIPLARGRMRDIAVGVGTFAATQLLGLALLPAESLRYWGHVVWDAGRIGNVGYLDNVSLRGLTTRLDLPGGVWLAVALLVVAAGFVVIRRLDDGSVTARSGADPEPFDPRVPLGIAATVMLLISPISWVHHYVWWPVMAFAWWRAGRRFGMPGRLLAALLGTFVATQVVSAKVWMMAAGLRPQDTPPWWALLHSDVTALVPAVALLALAAAALRTSTPTRPVSGDPMPTSADDGIARVPL